MRSDNAKRHLKRMKQRMSGSSQAVITTVDADNDVLMTNASGTNTNISHPFASKDAWIRSMPSTGTRVTLMYNQATNKYDFVAYVPLTTSGSLDDYRNKKSLYRVLREGEHEVKSIGNAVSFWGSRSYQSTRAGAVQSTHDGEKLEHVVRAPTILLRGHRHKADRIGNEIRFGVVKRPLTNVRENYVLKAPLSMPELDKYTYTYEYLMNLTNDQDSPLIDIRQGEVYEDLPQPGYPFSLPYLGANGFPVRSLSRYHAVLEPLGTSVPKTYTEEEIDTFGNVTWTLSKLAVIGFAIKVPFGSYNVNAMLNAQITGKLGVTIESTVGKVTTSGLAGLVNTTPAKYSLDAKLGIDEKTNGKYSLSASGGADLDSPLVINISGGAGVNIKSTGPVKVSGSAGVTLAGAMGSVGRPIASGNCLVTGLPLWVDATVKL